METVTRVVLREAVRREVGLRPASGGLRPSRQGYMNRCGCHCVMIGSVRPAAESMARSTRL